jgi:hypothetical protein
MNDISGPPVSLLAFEKGGSNIHRVSILRRFKAPRNYLSAVSEMRGERNKTVFIVGRANEDSRVFCSVGARHWISRVMEVFRSPRSALATEADSGCLGHCRSTEYRDRFRNHAVDRVPTTNGMIS